MKKVEVSEYVGTGHCPVHNNNISNYKLQNTNYKQTTNPKFQIPKKVMPCGPIVNAFGGQYRHTPPPLGAPLSRGETMSFSAIRPLRGNIFLL